jgi:hypothetical protein
MGRDIGERKLSRRDFLRLGAAAFAGAALSGCAGAVEETLDATSSAASLPVPVRYPARPLPERFVGVYTSWWGGSRQEERDFIDDLVGRAPGLGVSVLNLNFAWITLQPEESTCDFEHMQDLVTRIKRGGMQCVLRVYGQMGEIQLWPEWLRPHLEHVYDCPGMFTASVTNPAPWDAGYQSAFGDFLQRLGRWFREQAESVPDAYQISLGGAYGEQYLGCYTHFTPYEEELRKYTVAGKAAVDAHAAVLGGVIPDLILMGCDLKPVIQHAMNLGVRWIQRNDGARDILYPPWDDKIPMLRRFPSGSFILEDESGWSHYQDPLQARVDLLNELESEKGFCFQGVFVHSKDVTEVNRSAFSNLRLYLDRK